MEAIPTITSPLLPATHHVPKTNQYGTVADISELEAILGDNGQIPLQTTPLKEAKLLFKYSVPLCLTYLLQYSFSLITIFTVGHIGTSELGAVSLATMTANITGYAVYEGLASSLDTLCAQAYGSGRKELVGLHLQRMVLLMLLVTIPIAALWSSSTIILTALVPEKDLAIVAGRYLRILIFSTPGFAVFEAGKRFTQAQGLFNASLYVLLAIFPLNITFNYVFVFVLNWGLTGAVTATVLSNTLLPIFLFLVVYFIYPSSLECWPGFTTSALRLRNWGPMVRLAVPGIIMIEAEWLAFDILTFSASYLSTAHLAAQSVIITIGVVMYHIPFSVSVAVSTRLGNLIGAGELATARTATRTYVFIFAVIGLVDSNLLFALRHVLPKGFTQDPEVVAIAVGVLPVSAVFQIFEASTNFVNSILKGLGAQTVGGVVNLVVFYCVAVPLALFLCFGPLELKLKGLWIGCVVGSGLITLVAGTYCKCADWSKAVDRARRRDG